MRLRLAQAFAQAMPALDAADNMRTLEGPLGVWDQGSQGSNPLAAGRESAGPEAAEGNISSTLPLDTGQKFSRLLRYLQQRLPQMQQLLLEAHGYVLLRDRSIQASVCTDTCAMAVTFRQPAAKMALGKHIC